MISGKIKNPRKLKNIVKTLHRKRKKVVFTNGCFDIIHVGHVRLLRKARSLGDVLILGLNSDVSVRKLKGRNRPVVRQKYRAEVMAAIEYVDYVTVFDEKTPFNLIKELRPDIVVKGGDWPADKVVGREFARVVRVPLARNWSTSGIITKIRRSAR